MSRGFVLCLSIKPVHQYTTIDVSVNLNRKYLYNKNVKSKLL